MADTITLTGSMSTTPTDATSSGLAQVLMQISEQMVLNNVVVPGRYDLTSDSPQSVALGAITNVQLLSIKPIGVQHVRVRVTSADGSSQSFPVDTLAIIISQNVPITAIDLTRSAGVETLVEVILAGN